MVETAIKKYVDSFNGFIALKNNQIDGKYNQEVSPSKKHDDNRLHKIIISKESITSSKKKLEACYIELPLKESIKKQLKSPDCRPRIKIPENIWDKACSGGNHSNKEWKDV